MLFGFTWLAISPSIFWADFAIWGEEFEGSVRKHVDGDCDSQQFRDELPVLLSSLRIDLLHDIVDLPRDLLSWTLRTASRSDAAAGGSWRMVLIVHPKPQLGTLAVVFYTSGHYRASLGITSTTFTSLCKCKVKAARVFTITGPSCLSRIRDPTLTLPSSSLLSQMFSNTTRAATSRLSQLSNQILPQARTMATLNTKFKLNTGAEIPAVGFGTWQDKDAQEDAVTEALKAGYRHIDTARMYVASVPVN